MREDFDLSEHELITLFERQPIDIWINSFGGCRSNYIRDTLKGKYSTYNLAYELKACHYIRPLHVDVKMGIFCYVEDVGIALTSQINRNLTHNFEKLREDENTQFSIDNWLDNIDRQIDNWINNSYFKTYIINTDNIDEHKEEFENTFSVELLPYKERETQSYHHYLEGHEDKINSLNEKLKSISDFTYIL